MKWNNTEKCPNSKWVGFFSLTMVKLQCLGCTPNNVYSDIVPLCSMGLTPRKACLGFAAWVLQVAVCETIPEYYVICPDSYKEPDQFWLDVSKNQTCNYFNMGWIWSLWTQSPGCSEKKFQWSEWGYAFELLPFWITLFPGCVLAFAFNV